jgi:hypothetical protein
VIDPLEALNELIRRDMNELADHMAAGACTDWADYQKCVGKMEGFAFAERHLLDVKRQHELGEEEN